MISILIALVVGGLAGYIASKILKTDEQMGVVLNVIVGVLGAMIGNFALAPLFNVSVDLANPTFAGFLLAVLGSVILLALLSLFFKRRA